MPRLWWCWCNIGRRMHCTAFKYLGMVLGNSLSVWGDSSKLLSLQCNWPLKERETKSQTWLTQWKIMMLSFNLPHHFLKESSELHIAFDLWTQYKFYPGRYDSLIPKPVNWWVRGSHVVWVAPFDPPGLSCSKNGHSYPADKYYQILSSYPPFEQLGLGIGYPKKDTSVVIHTVQIGLAGVPSHISMMEGFFNSS